MDAKRMRNIKYAILELDCGHNKILGKRYQLGEWVQSDIDEKGIREIWRKMKNKEVVSTICYKLDGGNINRLTIWDKAGPFRIDCNGKMGYDEEEQENIKVGYL